MIKDKKGFTEKVLNGTGIRVVRFFASWSGTSQVMDPIYKELSRQYSSKAAFFSVDVEALPQLRKELGVIELPTILFYENGMVIDFVNGMISKSALAEKIESIIK